MRETPRPQSELYRSVTGTSVHRRSRYGNRGKFCPRGLRRQLPAYAAVTRSASAASLASFIDRDRAALDIGVDLGIYTRHFAKFSRRVIAFEANPDSAAAATRFLGRSATIHWVALSSTNGAGQLRIPLRAGKLTTALGTVSAANFLGDAAFTTIEVPLRQARRFRPSFGRVHQARDRVNLLPFALPVTRLGGALTVLVALQAATVLQP
jgi:peptidoglycan/LPS O-acetylase OafA/YrhL